MSRKGNRLVNGYFRKWQQWTLQRQKSQTD